MSADARKRVCVLVREGRIEEGLRMASALPLCDHEVDVIVCARSLPQGPEVATHLDTLELSEARVLAAFDEPRVQRAELAELGGALTSYDHIITF